MNYKQMLINESANIDNLSKELQNIFSSDVTNLQVFFCVYALLIEQENNEHNLLKSDDLLALIQTKTDDDTFNFLQVSITEHWEKLEHIYAKYSNETLEAFLLTQTEFSKEQILETPSSIRTLAIKLLDIKLNDKVADFGTGAGAFLIDAYLENSNADYYGIEINTELKVIADIRTSILSPKIKIVQGDMFSINETIDYFEKIFAHYPLGMRLKELNNANVYLDALETEFTNIAKVTSADWIFNYLLVSKIKENGKAVAIMPNGSLLNSLDKPIREYFVKHGLIETIISLPERMFNSTAMGTSLIVFSKNNHSIRLIDARDIYTKGRRQNIFSAENIAEIINATTTDSEISCVVNLADIKKNDFLISPSNYLLKPTRIENGVEFGSLIKNITRGSHLKASELDEMIANEPTQFNYLMLSNLKDGFIDEELPYLKEIPRKFDKYCIHNGNLLIAKNGYPFKVAVASVSKDQKILGNGNLYIIELDENKVNPYYLQAFFTSEQGAMALQNIAVGFIMPNIAVNQLKKLIVPLFDIQTQKKIAERYLTKVTKIKKQKVKLEKAMLSLKNIFDKV